MEWVSSQAAFLSAIVGSDVAKSAAQAAVAALSEVSFNVQAENNEEIRPLSIEIDQRGMCILSAPNHLLSLSLSPYLIHIFVCLYLVVHVIF